MTHRHEKILVALTGQPNVGKSTIFNMLSGARQHVANYPGVTVEKKQGNYKYYDEKVELVDLPGTYSLSCYTQEERVARDFILLERPEVVVVVADASNLERNLNLVLQICEMGVPVVVCLNMMDVARRRGFDINIELLEKHLEVPVIETVGKKNQGAEKLKEAIHKVARATQKSYHSTIAWKIDYGLELENILKPLHDELHLREHLMEDFSARWLAVKLLEDDSEVRRIVEHHTHDETIGDLCEVIDSSLEEMRKHAGSEPTTSIISVGRFRYAEKIVSECTNHRKAGRSLTDKIDAVVLHPVWGTVVLLCVLFAFYQTTMGLGVWLSDLFEPFMQAMFRPLGMLFHRSDLLREGLLESMVMEGVLGGVTSLLYFLPVFFVLFAVLAIIEDSGYMARIAVMLDRLLRKFGLHGQSMLPMLLGGVVVGGCAVPGVMATRAMKDTKARMVTILIMPLLNCMAKIPFYVLIVGAFFPKYRGWILYGISIFNFAAVLLIARFLSRYVIKGESAPFILELPTYHLPTMGGVLGRAVQRSWLFVKKMFTVIVFAMVLVWFFITFPGIGHNREVQFDQQVESIRMQLAVQLDQIPQYASFSQPYKLIDFMKYRDDYAVEKQKYAHDSQALKALDDKFINHDQEMFGLVNADSGSLIKKRVSDLLGGFYSQIRTLSDQRKEEIVNSSYAACFGKILEPVTELAGFNWRINVGIVSALAARENIVATLGSIYSVESEGVSGGLGKTMQSRGAGWSMWHAVALLGYMLFCPPCIPTVLMIRSETGSYKWAAFSVLMPLVIGFSLAVLIFQFGKIF